MSLLNVISQEMTNDQLVVRNHVEDFNTKSQLIVYESQEALLYKSGQALDLFAPGRHSLTTENVPILKRVFGGLFGKNTTPFPCEVYFINKVNVLDILWGTDAPIQLEDPKYSIIVGVRANGQTGIRVKDSRRFVVKVVGQLKEYTTDVVRRAIKGMMMVSVKECIASAIVEKGVSILEITPKLSELSEMILEKLNARVADLGLELDHFTVNTISASEGDLDELSKAKSAASTMEVTSRARAKARAIEGYTYQEERRFDILDNAAKNEGATGGFINMGVGMGVGVGVSKEVANMTNSMRGNATGGAEGVTRFCSGCGTAIPATAKFCPNCGQQQEPQQRFCPECGNRCPADGKFCPNCGTRLV